MPPADDDTTPDAATASTAAIAPASSEGDLDELRARLAAQDAKLDASLRLNRRLLAAVALDRARAPLRRYARYLGLELALAVVALLLLGSFAYAHRDATRFVVPAAALAAAVVALARASAHQLALALQIDHGGPLADAQRRLAALRATAARTLLWTLAASPLLWPPLAIVLLAAIGVDAYVVPGVPWLLANLALGIAVLGAAVLVARRHGHRLAAHPRLRRLALTLAGHSLAAAAARLDEVAAFTDEPA